MKNLKHEVLGSDALAHLLATPKPRALDSEPEARRFRRKHQKMQGSVFRVKGPDTARCERLL